ncbi:MAG: serine hydrolase [Saprospiraceae bacterium]
MMLKFLQACTLSVLMTLGATAQKNYNPDLPLHLSDRYIVPLRSLEDASLQTGLAQKLNANPTWKKLIANKKLAVGLVDLSDQYNIRYAAVNGDEMMYAASLPKIAVLLASEDAIAKGELKPTQEVLSDMRLMISRSNNQATTRMIDRVGYKKISNVLTDPKYKLYDKNYGGGLWVGKRYAAGGARNPDPLEGLSHAASVSQVCRFYYMLAMGKLVSSERSEHMLQMMSDPELHHKFINTLDKTAPGAKLYRKSGTWQNFHADSVLVWGDGWQRYILVGLAEDAEGEQIMRDLVTAVEDVLKKKTLLVENGPFQPKNKG